MADRAFSNLLHYGRNRVMMAGRFRPNGTSAVDNTLNKGKGWTVARTSAGKFTVTLSSELNFSQIDHVEAKLWLNAADDKQTQLGAVSAANRTIVINVWDISGGAVADVASNANNWISFMLVARTSSEEQ